MRIGILETGMPPAGLDRVHGSYAAMVRTLLGEGHEFAVYRAGALPTAPEACDGYVVTGSSAGVHDPLPWIDPLAAFLRGCRGRAKLVGICFGHQLIAHAFGGTVGRAPQGWGIGLHRYTLDADVPGLGAGPLAVIASHQDQVIAPPPDAVVLGGSAFTPNGLLAYGDDAITLQCHPEFTARFARALTAAHDSPAIDAAARTHALASLGRPHDNDRLARWIAAFLRGNAAGS